MYNPYLKFTEFKCSNAYFLIKACMGWVIQLGEQYYCVIEVKVPSGPRGWQILVNDRMKNVLEGLRATVEELGGKVHIRY